MTVAYTAEAHVCSYSNCMFLIGDHCSSNILLLLQAQINHNCHCVKMHPICVIHLQDLEFRILHPIQAIWHDSEEREYESASMAKYSKPMISNGFNQLSLWFSWALESFEYWSWLESTQVTWSRLCLTRKSREVQHLTRLGSTQVGYQLNFESARVSSHGNIKQGR
jgi:hypothetical protein